MYSEKEIELMLDKAKDQFKNDVFAGWVDYVIISETEDKIEINIL